MRGPHPGLPGRAHRCINQNVATRLNRDLHALDAPRVTIYAQVHTPQYTNYGYNNAAGDDESKMVAEGTKLCINQILAARRSTRHLLDGVEVPVPHRSTEPERT